MFLKSIIGFFLFLCLFSVQGRALPPELGYGKDYAALRAKLYTEDVSIVRYAYESGKIHIVDPAALTEMDYYLADPGSGYDFKSPPEYSLMNLETLIQENAEKLKVAKDRSPRELLLGDTYHWLGHLYEEKGELLLAYECYIRSQVHYSKTALKKSPRINQRLIVQEHAEFHLRDIADTLRKVVRVTGPKTLTCSMLF